MFTNEKLEMTQKYLRTERRLLDFIQNNKYIENIHILEILCVSQFTLYHSMKESDSFYFEFETYFYFIVAFFPNLLYLKTLIKLLLLIKGNKPDFRSAMSGDKSLELYNQVTFNL